MRVCLHILKYKSFRCLQSTMIQGAFIVFTIVLTQLILQLLSAFAPPFQEAEQARKTLLELQAVAAAVESSGQAKAEAKVGGHHGFVPRASLTIIHTVQEVWQGMGKE